MNALFEFVLEFALSIVWWILLFPAIWLLATPFILVIAMFRREPYRFGVMKMYGAVTDIWKEWGIAFVP